MQFRSNGIWQKSITVNYYYFIGKKLIYILLFFRIKILGAKKLLIPFPIGAYASFPTLPVSNHILNLINGAANLKQANSIQSVLRGHRRSRSVGPYVAEAVTVRQRCVHIWCDEARRNLQANDNWYPCSPHVRLSFSWSQFHARDAAAAVASYTAHIVDVIGSSNDACKHLDLFVSGASTSQSPIICLIPLTRLLQRPNPFHVSDLLS